MTYIYIYIKCITWSYPKWVIFPSNGLIFLQLHFKHLPFIVLERWRGTMSAIRSSWTAFSFETTMPLLCALLPCPPSLNLLIWGTSQYSWFLSTNKSTSNVKVPFAPAHSVIAVGGAFTREHVSSRLQGTSSFIWGSRSTGFSLTPPFPLPNISHVWIERQPTFQLAGGSLWPGKRQNATTTTSLYFFFIGMTSFLLILTRERKKKKKERNVVVRLRNAPRLKRRNRALQEKERERGWEGELFGDSRWGTKWSFIRQSSLSIRLWRVYCL